MTDRVRCFAAPLLALLLVAASGRAEEVAEPSDEGRAAARAKLAAEDKAEALQALKRMSDYLAAQKNFSFTADVGYDVRQTGGQMLEFGGSRNVTVRRPDRIRIEAHRRSGEPSVLTFDGQDLSIDLPDEKAYVSVKKPGSIDAALDYLVDDLGVPAPLADLVHANFYAEVGDTVESGLPVGDTWFGERHCRHFAFTGSETNSQLWIEVGDRPLPCRVVIHYKNAAGGPRFWAQIDAWNLSDETPVEEFHFEPASGAERLPLRAVASGARAQGEAP
jgi:hypothetical protein